MNQSVEMHAAGLIIQWTSLSWHHHLQNLTFDLEFKSFQKLPENISLSSCLLILDWRVTIFVDDKVLFGLLEKYH